MPIHAYLTVKGTTMGVISQGSKEQGRPGGIRVYRIDHNLLVPIDVASGLPTGKRRHMPLKICKKIDDSSPMLYRAMSTAEQVECNLKLYDWEGGVETQYYTIKLNKSIINEIRIFEAVALDPDHEELDPMEEISFSYDTIIWKHEPSGHEYEDVWGHAV